jgi:hypothetical protein
MAPSDERDNVISLFERSGPLVTLAPLLSSELDGDGDEGKHWSAHVVLLHGMAGVGKSTLATRTLFDLPGSIYLTTDEGTTTVGRRKRLIHNLHGGRDFEVRDAHGVKEIEKVITSWRQGVICLDALTGHTTAWATGVIRFHRAHGKVPLLVLDGRRASDRIMHHADVTLLQESDRVIEEKHRYRKGPTRRFRFDIRAICGEDFQGGWGI